jgi:hypothetical protein
MGRPLKVGLDYYRLNTNRYGDLKIRKLIGEFATEGIAVYDFILNQIFKEQGFFIELTDKLMVDVSTILKVKESVVADVINCLTEVSLFDKKIFQTFNILTSQLVQKEFVLINHSYGRRKTEIPKHLQLYKPKTKSEKNKKKSIKKVLNIEERKQKLAAQIEQHKDKYPSLMLRAFYKYWTEEDGKGNIKRDGQKFWNIETRLEAWKNNNNKYSNNGSTDKPSFFEKQFNDINENTGGFEDPQASGVGH